MIYLIGGPPKCGKTTLAKKMSKQLGIPWISADTLQSIGREYSSSLELKNKYPHASMRKGNKNNDSFYNKYTTPEIIAAYRKQAKATALAIETLILCEITDGNDYIIEGYQITPSLAVKLRKKHGPDKISAIFLSKRDSKEFVRNIKKSTTPNDWILANTKKEKTFEKIADMIGQYSIYFESEAKKSDLNYIDLSQSFEAKLPQAIKILLDNKS